MTTNRQVFCVLLWLSCDVVFSVQRFNQIETSYTELQGKHADIMAVKMKLEKNISNLTTALDNEKSSQNTVTDQVEELQGIYTKIFDLCYSCVLIQSDPIVVSL